MSLTWIALGLATVFLLIYLFFQHKYTYWMSKNVFFLPPVFPFGNFKGVQRQRSLGQIVRNIYSSNKSQPAVGVWIFAKPALIINDLELIRTILIKEFNSFMDRGVLQADKYDPLTGHLFLLRGKKWKNIRIKLTPTFTSGKMKMVFPTLLKCGDDFKDHLKKAAEREEVLEMKNVLSSFTLDVIASCAFGLEINAFKNPDSEFKRMSDFFFNPNWMQSLKNFFAILFPKLLQVLKWKTVPEEVTKFFIGVVEDTFDHREKNKIERNDFVQLLLELKNKGRIDDPDAGELEGKDKNFDSTFTIEQAAAQAFVFFIAGFETSSSTMMFCLFELARNQDIQERLREEMDKIIDKHNGKITYEGLQEMEYLDQVISETLRLYPPAPILVRECTKHCYIPQLNAIIEKGTRIFIPVLGIHHNSDYYPDPEKFDPDRFSTKNKKNRDPMCHLPFGDGPRICIGMRFAQMQSKAGLTMLLTNYKVELSEKTEIPLRFDPKVIFTSVIGGIHLKIRKR